MTTAGRNAPPIGSPVVLTTDFGLSDAFVGVMKGVILNINPQANVIDLTHDIQPQNIRQASFVLGVNYPYFPPHTIHVAVVDPGVGTERRALLLVTPTARFVAPDNGLLSHVLKDYLDSPPVRSGISGTSGQLGRIPVPPGLTAYALTNLRYRLNPVSSTFHGRDVFAPAAAHLSRGVSPQRLGGRVEDVVWLPLPEPTRAGDAVEGEVIYTDRFGNLVTNIRSADLKEDVSVVIAIGSRRIAGLSRTFHDPHTPQPDSLLLVALIGSNGYLEIAVRDGNAAQVLGLGPGAPVSVSYNP